ncbi:MAG: ribonuclease III [Bacteroidota bacterium]
MRWGLRKKDTFFERKIKLIFKNNFGFVPADLHYYKEALMHRSALDRRPGATLNSNERLEFLGDSLLGAYAASYLFRKYPDGDEGFLTKLRSKIVSRNHLNKLAFDLQINQLVKNAIAQDQEANTIYGNALEAVIGAIYLEKGIGFLNKVLQTIFEKYINVKNIENTETDYKSRLFEHAQRERKPLRFNVISESMVQNRKFYTVEATLDQYASTGEGFSKKKAEQEASRSLLEKITLA